MEKILSVLKSLLLLFSDIINEEKDKEYYESLKKTIEKNINNRKSFSTDITFCANENCKFFIECPRSSNKAPKNSQSSFTIFDPSDCPEKQFRKVYCINEYCKYKNKCNHQLIPEDIPKWKLKILDIDSNICPVVETLE